MVGGSGEAGNCGGGRSRNAGRVRGSEEELEIYSAEKIGGVNRVSGGEVRFSDKGHTETPREALGGVGGIATPEFYMVEALY